MTAIHARKGDPKRRYPAVGSATRPRNSGAPVEVSVMTKTNGRSTVTSRTTGAETAWPSPPVSVPFSSTWTQVLCCTESMINTPRTADRLRVVMS
jgi:hypothetical protein